VRGIGVLRTSSEEEVVETVTFLASAKAGAITGTFVNVTSEMFSS
jgi:NAD(P)-dependent dehydrogenase (short-subunit alcohol dehydrogenase family)